MSAFLADADAAIVGTLGTVIILLAGALVWIVKAAFGRLISRLDTLILEVREGTKRTDALATETRIFHSQIQSMLAPVSDPQLRPLPGRSIGGG